MSDLWHLATSDLEAEHTERRILAARQAAASTWTFLAGATSRGDFENRRALVGEQLDKAAAAATASEPVHYLATRVALEDSFLEDFEALHTERQAEAQRRNAHRAHLRRQEAEAKKKAERLARTGVQARDVKPGQTINGKVVKSVDYSPSGGGKAYVVFEDGTRHTFPAAYQVKAERLAQSRRTATSAPEGYSQSYWDAMEEGRADATEGADGPECPFCGVEWQPNPDGDGEILVHANDCISPEAISERDDSGYNSLEMRMLDVTSRRKRASGRWYVHTNAVRPDGNKDTFFTMGFDSEEEAQAYADEMRGDDTPGNRWEVEVQGPTTAARKVAAEYIECEQCAVHGVFNCQETVADCDLCGQYGDVFRYRVDPANPETVCLDCLMAGKHMQSAHIEGWQDPRTARRTSRRVVAWDMPGSTASRKQAVGGTCDVCGRDDGGMLFGSPCMDCVKARQRAAMDGRCHCGAKKIPGEEQKPFGERGRKWIPCERCLGTIRQTGSRRTAGNPHPVGDPAWFRWEDEAAGRIPDSSPETKGPKSGVPRDLFPDGIPLRGDLTPEQQAWLDKRGQRRRTAATPTGRSNYQPGQARMGEPTPQSDPDAFSSEDILAEIKYLIGLNKRHGTNPLRTMKYLDLMKILDERGFSRQAARSDYDHWNEEADYVWYQEEGRHIEEPDADYFYERDFNDEDYDDDAEDVEEDEAYWAAMPNEPVGDSYTARGDIRPVMQRRHAARVVREGEWSFPYEGEERSKGMGVDVLGRGFANLSLGLFMGFDPETKFNYWYVVSNPYPADRSQKVVARGQSGTPGAAMTDCERAARNFAQGVTVEWYEAEAAKARAMYPVEPITAAQSEDTETGTCEQCGAKLRWDGSAYVDSKGRASCPKGGFHNAFEDASARAATRRMAVSLRRRADR